MAVGLAAITRGASQSDGTQNGVVISAVTGPDEQRLDKATVEVLDAQTGDVVSETAATTDVDGRFELILPAGTYTLKASAEGYNDQTTDTITVETGQVLYLAWIELEPLEGWAAEQGLISYIAFDGDYRDQVTGVTGTAHGDTDFWWGIKGEAIYLDGDGDYVSFGTGYNLPAEFTLNAWVKAADVSRHWPAVFAKYQVDGYGPYVFSLNYEHSGYWVSKGDGDHIEGAGEAVLAADQWHMLTWVVSGDTIKLYVDGLFDTEGPWVTPQVTDDEVTVGRQAFMFDPFSDLEFKGFIDEIAIYSRAFADNEVATRYKSISGEDPGTDSSATNTTSDTDVVGVWRFDSIESISASESDILAAELVYGSCVLTLEEGGTAILNIWGGDTVGTWSRSGNTVTTTILGDTDIFELTDGKLVAWDDGMLIAFAK
ncbi:MAG: carboxypeptidase regulatory-like domain-containing protein [Bifidobacteriaceae bacterium]|nr:carboxypeptidase regulatory-like domain-containing protein [Bifidobacteriaceae bacterium]